MYTLYASLFASMVHSTVGSAPAVVIRAALLFVVHFPVTKHKHVVFVILTSSTEGW